MSYIRPAVQIIAGALSKTRFGCRSLFFPSFDSQGFSPNTNRTIEVNLAITCGCLPVLQPLFRKIRLLVPFLPSYLRSKLSSGRSAMQQRSWPQKLTGPRAHQVHDVEQGSGLTRKAPWREPDESESCESGGSSLSMYHLQRQQQQQQQQEGPMVRSALEPVVVRPDRLGTEEESKGFAM